jgi:hypothetical protein
MQTWLQKVKNRYHWSNKIKVSKQANFICEGDLLKTHIYVDANNTVHIGQQTALKKVELKVVGENNRLIIGDHCYIENDVPAKAAAFED